MYSCCSTCLSKIIDAFTLSSVAKKYSANDLSNSSAPPQIYIVKEKEMPKLHLAAWKGDYDKLQQLAKQAGKINLLDKEGR